MKKILITGGEEFISSHVIRRFVKNYPNYQFFNLDVLLIKKDEPRKNK